jgi:UDP-glucose 4-epimerase
MSEGTQVRDYLSVEKAAEYIVKISMQNKVCGIINCCSGKGVSIKNFIEDYIRKNGINIKLNTGFFKFNDYEPMDLRGDTKKLELALL